MSDTVQPLDPADDGVVLACYEAHTAAMAADDPFEPPVSLTAFTARLRAGSFEPPREAWCVPSEADGAVAAWYEGNGWSYPVPGPQAAGLDAVRQFFLAVGQPDPFAAADGR